MNMIESARQSFLNRQRSAPVVRWLLAFVIVPAAVWITAEWGFSRTSDAPVWFVAFGMICMMLMPRIMLRLALPCGEMEAIRARELKRLIGASRRSDPRLMVWRTGARVCNATIQCGFPGRPRILFSDLMLKHFSNEELAAVARHELSHWKGGHTALRFFSLTAPLLLLITFDLLSEFQWLVAIRESGLHFQMSVAGFFVLCLTLLLNILMFQITAYYCEFDADRGAIEMPGTNLVCREKAVSLLRVFQKMASLAPRTRSYGSLAHPSLQTRMARVQSRLARIHATTTLSTVDMESA
jgi:Zn-dependent protease with chaperone function